MLLRHAWSRDARARNPLGSQAKAGDAQAGRLGATLLHRRGCGHAARLHRQSTAQSTKNQETGPAPREIRRNSGRDGQRGGAHRRARSIGDEYCRLPCVAARSRWEARRWTSGGRAGNGERARALAAASPRKPAHGSCPALTAIAREGETDGGIPVALKRAGTPRGRGLRLRRERCDGGTQAAPPGAGNRRFIAGPPAAGGGRPAGQARGGAAEQGRVYLPAKQVFQMEVRLPEASSKTAMPCKCSCGN